MKKLSTKTSLRSIDEVNVSIKTEADRKVFKSLVGNPIMSHMKDNQLYVFDDLFPDDTTGFKVIKRKWQPEFVPADDSIFRKI